MLHSWSDDDAEYEALGLRVMLRDAGVPLPSRQAAIDLGLKTYSERSDISHQVWMDTFRKGITFEEHAAAMKADPRTVELKKLYGETS